MKTSFLLTGILISFNTFGMENRKRALPAVPIAESYCILPPITIYKKLKREIEPEPMALEEAIEPRETSLWEQMNLPDPYLQSK